MPRNVDWLAVAALLFGASVAFSQERFDAQGEPLPAGAIARLGSNRWRHGHALLASAISRDGKLLATASVESVAVWDTSTGKVLFRFPAYSREIRSVSFGYYKGSGILAFSPDGTKLGCAIGGPCTGMWDLRNGGAFRRFGGDDDGFQGICRFSPDGREFMLIDGESFRFFDPRTGKQLRRTPATWVWDVAPDGRHYTQIDFDRDAAFNVRNTGSNAIKMKFKADPNTGTVCFAPDSKSVLVVDDKARQMQIWDIADDRPRATFATPKTAIDRYADTKDEFLSYRVCFSANGRQILMGTRGGTIHRWDIASKKELPVLGKHLGDVVGVHDLPDGKTLISTGRDGTIRRWDTIMNREIGDLGDFQGSTVAALSKDGHLAAIADGRGRVDLWDMKSVQRLRTVREKGDRAVSLAFSPAEDTLAVGLESGTLCLHEVASGRETSALPFKKAHKNYDLDWCLWTMLYSPDGRYLCVYCGAGELQMWDIKKREARWRTQSDSSWPPGVCAAFSPDGKTLAYVRGPKLCLLDVETGKEQRAKELGAIHNLVFAPDGRSLAVNVGEWTTEILDGRTLEEVKRLRTGGHLGGLAFAPDNQTLAVASMEDVHIWDTVGGKEVHRLRGHRDSVTTVVFSPDGRTLLSSGEDGQVYLWSVPGHATKKADPR